MIASEAEADGFRALGRDVLAIEEVSDHPADPAALPAVPGEAWGRISFTSGTTGSPKAIVTTHAARWIGNVCSAHISIRCPGPAAASC